MAVVEQTNGREGRGEVIEEEIKTKIASSWSEVVEKGRRNGDRQVEVD
jgi:hypothetical protein